MLSWCDKLASVPSAGFQLDWNFAPSSAVLDAFTPLLNTMMSGDNQQFSIARQDAFNVNINGLDGFNYGIEPSKVYVTFQHSMKAKPVSGGPPTIEMLSHPLPFTKLLPAVTHRLKDATLVVPGNKTRKIRRVGIITSTSVDEDDAPPGIKRFIQYMGRPWTGNVNTFSFQISSQIEKSSKHVDSCVHTLTKPLDPEELLTLSFDWQRTFVTGRPIKDETVSAILEEAEKSALAYFEDLAEGNRFDEDIIRSAN